MSGTARADALGNPASTPAALLSDTPFTEDTPVAVLEAEKNRLLDEMHETDLTITDIKGQLAHAQRRMSEGETVDKAWLIRAQMARGHAGRARWATQEAIAEINRIIRKANVKASDARVVACLRLAGVAQLGVDKWNAIFAEAMVRMRAGEASGITPSSTDGEDGGAT